MGVLFRDRIVSLFSFSSKKGELRGGSEKRFFVVVVVFGGSVPRQDSMLFLSLGPFKNKKPSTK